MNTILFSVNKNIATISFNRPEAMNCFNHVMGDELETVTEEVRLNSSIRAVLLNGTGSLFMAGGDINYFNDLLDTMPAGVMKLVRRLNASILNLMHMPKPVVASVHGSVAGVGMSFMMACDLVIASSQTKFNMAYSGIGITPDGGAAFNLPRLVGTKKAMELILLSDMFDAHKAEQMGLVNWVVAAEDLEKKTHDILNRLAKGPTQAFARSKSLINNSCQHSLESHLESEGEAFEHSTLTQDFRAGVKGFLTKSKFEFIGQ